MRPVVKGPTPWAMVLCRFSNIPELALPLSVFSEFVTEAGTGKGGVFDYWRDISYGAIDLTGSIVTGWHTMQFSFPQPSDLDRAAFAGEARRLATASGIDLSRFYGVIAVVNGNVADGNVGPGQRYGTSPRDVVLGIGGAWGQAGWRHCQKCQGLFFSLNPSQGVCPSDKGPHSVSGSGDYSMALEIPNFPSQNNWRLCNKCEGLFFAGSPVRGTPLGTCPAGGTHAGTGSPDFRVALVGQIHWETEWRWCWKCQGLFFGGPPAAGLPLGKCPAGGTHDLTDSANYTLTQNTSSLNVTYAAHEMGHGYGLWHSYLDAPVTEYGDPFDIMSALNVNSFDAGEPFRTSGPGLNAPYLDTLGWLPENRIRTFDPVPQGNITFAIAALNRPDIGISPLMARVITPDRIYMIEYRQPTGWDRNFQHPGILVHSSRTLFNQGQYGWRWCPKCQGMFLALHAICPAGGLHDHTGSGNYTLAVDDPSAVGQKGWAWCWKCEGLFFNNGQNPLLAACPAGGWHNGSLGGAYTLTLDDPAADGQSNWRWCNKCQGLAFAGNSWPGSCPAGGYHDHSGSSNYTLANQSGVVGQNNWQWCRKCQGLAFAGRGACPAGGPHIHQDDTVNLSRVHGYCLVTDIEIAAGQHRWRRCIKCMGLFYSGNASPGPCPAQGLHDDRGSGDYTLPVVDDPHLLAPGGPPFLGLDRWRWCNKCQGLTFTGNGFISDPPLGPCPAGDSHNHQDSGDYWLISGTQSDLSYLMRPSLDHDPLLGPGEVFQDTSRNILIRVESINTNPDVALAMVTVGPAL